MNIFAPQLKPKKVNPFKKAFLHLDGDSFFAACEVALNPSLRGKPVVTGLERGIASAMTYEAKAKGITRGMRLFEMKKICPEVIILPSDYETYSIFSERMYNIVRRYAPNVEEYSIDECFADISEEVERIYLKGGGLKEVTALAQAIKDDLTQELGMTFSVGVGSTKVIAKIGSKLNKPNGLTVIAPDQVKNCIANIPINKIWGIGASTSVTLSKKGIRSALDFAERPEWWVREQVSKPYVAIWNELNGVSVMDIKKSDDHVYKSMSKTRTFTPATDDKYYVFSELSKNIEGVCLRARKAGLLTPRVSYFIKTSDFRYQGMEISLEKYVNTPEVIIEAVKKTFDSVFRPGTKYRASGITISGLVEDRGVQPDLFNYSPKRDALFEVYRKVDDITREYGRQTVFLASSLKAMQREDDDERLSKRNSLICKNNRMLAIPFMGEVR